MWLICHEQKAILPTSDGTPSQTMSHWNGDRVQISFSDRMMNSVRFLQANDMDSPVWDLRRKVDLIQK